MNEKQARQLAQVYEDMGYQTRWEQTGGGVHVVYLTRHDGTVITFGLDSITLSENMGDAESGYWLTVVGL